MTGFLQAIKFQSAAPQLIGDDDSAGVVQKLQKNVCMCLTLYATKYDEEFSGYLEGFVQVEKKKRRRRRKKKERFCFFSYFL